MIANAFHFLQSQKVTFKAFPEELLPFDSVYLKGGHILFYIDTA